MAKLKLASRGINVSGMTGGIKPVTLTAGQSAARSLSAPFVNPGIANIKFSPFTAPSIVVDTSLDSVAALANVWTQKAFEFQMKESQAKANQKLLDLEKQVMFALHGDDQTPGYLSKVGQEAVESYRPFDDSIRSMVAQATMNEEPHVRARMLEKAKRLELTSLTQAAAHKSREMRTWQDQIVKEQYNGVKRDIFRYGNNPEEFQQALNSYEQMLAQQFAAQPVLRDLHIQGFRNDIYKDMIDLQLDSGNFKMASEYMNRAITAEADPNIIAERANKMTKLIQAERDAELSRMREQMQMDKLYREQLNAQVLNEFVTTQDYSVFDKITNIEDRLTLQSLAEKWQEGINDPNAEAEMYAQRVHLANEPELVLKSEFFPGVGAKQRIAFHSSLVADRKQLVKDVKDLAVDWLETIVPMVPNGLAGRIVESRFAPTYLRMQQQLFNAIEQAQIKGVDIHKAYYDARTQIMRSEEFSDEFKELKIPEHSLTYITGLGSYNIIKQKDFILEDDGARIHKLKQAYDTASLKLLEKYGFPPGTKITDPIVQQRFLSDPNAMLELSKDSTYLEEQRRFILQQITTDTPKNSSRATGPNTGVDFSTFGQHIKR